MHIPGEAKVRPRIESDGEVCSIPFNQQIYITVLEADHVPVKCTFILSSEAVCMQPFRARVEQAIQGQVGRPLIHGVSGLYDVLDDYLIDWYGRDWEWAQDEMTLNEDGTLSVTINLDLGYKAWIINLRPQYYRRHLGYPYYEPWKTRPELKPVSGWCSWEAYRRDITEENIAAVTRFMAKHFKPYGFEYMQIDDGFQQQPIGITKEQTLKEHWLTSSEVFPNGLEGLVKDISDNGLTPAIWINTDIRKYDPPEDMPDCLLRDDKGEVIDASFMGPPMDWSDETIENHYVPVVKALKDLGFKYIKIDALRHTIYDALQMMAKKGLWTNDEVERRFRNLLDSCRKAMGDDTYFLVSWGVFTEAVGLCDACRIATDSNPAWRKVRMQLVEQGRWWHTQRILFVNDPDHICIRTKPEWGKTLLSNVSLTGGLMMLSDPIDLYDEQRIYNIQRCMPPLKTYTAETGPLDVRYQAYAWTKMHGVAFTGSLELDWQEVTEDDAYLLAGDHETMEDNHPLSSLWSFHIKTDAGKWCVVQRIGTLPLKPSTLHVSKLGLDPSKAYIGFDFWNQKYLGEIKVAFEVGALETGFTEVFALREKLEHPQFIASSRHVSMDAVSVKTQEWSDGTLTLDLDCPENTTETYWFHCPAGWQFDAAQAEGTEIEMTQSEDGTAVALAITFQQRETRLAVTWKKA